MTLSVLAFVSVAVPAQVLVPGFTKTFSPDTIALGGLSTLTFTINNSDSGSPADNVQFSDTLPAGVIIASPASAGTTCSRGIVDATGGGSTITFSDGGVAAFETCTVFVNVTSSTPGTHTNVSGDMTSDAGNSGSATDDLTVDASLPLFAKAFAPDTIAQGGTSTLTFTIDNSANGAAIGNLAFTDNLPAGVTVASPANASTTCTGGTLTAASGTGVIGYSGGSVPANSSCAIDVDVTSSAAGTHVNTTGNLISDAGNSGPASDSLMVTQPPRPPTLFKQFSPATIAAGAVSTVRLIVDHTSGTVAATSLSVTDNLPAGVTVASPANASTTCSGGTVTATPGTGVVSYSGGSVAAGVSCTVEADVTSTTPGTHINTTGDLTSSLGNGGSATDTLEVTAVPVPTAGTWALIALALALAMVGLWSLQNHLAIRS